MQHVRGGCTFLQCSDGCSGQHESCDVPSHSLNSKGLKPINPKTLNPKTLAHNIATIPSPHVMDAHHHQCITQAQLPRARNQHNAVCS
eukprot:121485-Chlamydomonas_euryale.AAC.2